MFQPEVHEGPLLMPAHPSIASASSALRSEQPAVATTSSTGGSPLFWPSALGAFVLNIARDTNALARQFDIAGEMADMRSQPLAH